jgi:hypothetical protein
VSGSLARHILHSRNRKSGGNHRGIFVTWELSKPEVRRAHRETGVAEDVEHGVERKRDVDETPVVLTPQICDPHSDHYPQNVEESLFACF